MLRPEIRGAGPKVNDDFPRVLDFMLNCIPRVQRKPGFKGVGALDQTPARQRGGVATLGSAASGLARISTDWQRREFSSLLLLNLGDAVPDDYVAFAVGYLEVVCFSGAAPAASKAFFA
jgi:hypothetical protein